MSASVSRRTFLGIAGGAVSVLGLAACNSGDSGASDDANAASDGDASDKTYIVATDTTFAPFEFTNEANEFVGIDVDILAAISADQGFQYDLNSLGFDAAVAALESNQADAVIAGMSITEERLEKYDFSDPYYDSYVCAAARDGGDYQSLEDLNGMTVACKTGTQSASWAESIAEEYGFSITYFDTSDMMYQDVLTGNTAACFEDYPVMAYGVAQGNGLTIIGTDEEEFATPYGFAVMKGENPELIEMFNAGLANIRESGEYDEIVAKYLEA
ncbi:MAG TPA: transporter substrate-binding domain-containing protein [Candidatus Olsenella pullistercoris]|uniref:Transporter substrate-binding domain-containing protein n=1 Tax=Candidatus Olsenella pullistercoris TaxID=2838712 RepID=A0A9D2JE74_9ACTN|nr:transporter substrate-binding domain-containing protein [Candidatus Olsenella pullistercoris]